LIGHQHNPPRGESRFIPALTKPHNKRIPRLEPTNWVDWLLGLFLLLKALEGAGRGLLLGAFDLLGAVVTLGVAIIGYASVGGWIVSVAHVPTPLANVAGFVLLAFVTDLVYGIVLRLLVSASWPIVSALGVFKPLNHLLGIAPGLIRGLLVATPVLLVVSLVPVVPQLSDAVKESAVGSRLTALALTAAPEAEAWLARELGDLPGITLAPPEPEQQESQPLPVTLVGALSVDPAAEEQMLNLVNQERVQNGLRPVTADERLRDVARAHSQEMFELRYFSHTSPVTGSPFDRMRAARIPFVLAGENLAFAPTVGLAHRGLMNSPGHRANILRAEFGRLGVGVIRSQYAGSMFSQEFAN
jgi:uncharacterized protein YkwD